LLVKTTEDLDKTRAAFAEGLLNRPRMNLTVSTGAACVPHNDKTKQGMKGRMRKDFGHAGEDAYFVKSREVVTGAESSGHETDAFVAFGVADGVFMWRSLGIDAGMFSRRLLGVASEVFAGEGESFDEATTGSTVSSRDKKTRGTLSDASKTIGAPEHLLEHAFAGVTSESILGSTTCCIATIDATHGVMRTANVGDSGFMLVRGDPGHREVAHRSPHQEHEFGRPFQLGHHDASDHPSDAMLTTFPLEPGDVIVMGSDGLWDNLSESEILQVVEGEFKGTGYQRGMGAESRAVVVKAAGAVVSAAYAASMDKRRTTPYSLAATENFDMVYSGGKKDDITAVVVNVG
jgi:protein phosphatase PTC7